MSNVWPFVPQRRFKERMEWRTEILRSKSAEQRICLRNLPRTSIELDYQLLPQEIEAATVMARQWGADEFLLPFWHEHDYVGNLPTSTTVINITTSYRRYKVGGSLFIMGSNGSYEVATISAVGGSAVTLTAPGVVTGYTGAVVMPCFPVYVKTPFSFRKYAADYHTASAEFISADDFEISSSNNYPSFNSSYVMTDRPIIAGNAVENHTREFDVFSNIAGPLFYSKPYDYPISSNSMFWSFNTTMDLWAFREWMYTVKGKQQSFYYPRWTRDFISELDISSSDDFIVVSENESLEDTYTGAICIVENDGTQTYAIIESWEIYGAGQRQANLSATIGADIMSSDIELICRMPKMRFNSDIIELDYLDGGVVDVRLPFMEVPE